MSSDILLNPISPLRHVHMGNLLPRIGGGGGGSAPASQNITQTNLPEYAEPYFKRLLDRTESLSLGDYQPFQGQRQAALPGDISGAYDITRQVAGQGIAGLPQAMGVVSGNVQAGQDIAQRAGQPFQFGGTQFAQQSVDPFAGFQAADAQQFQFDPHKDLLALMFSNTCRHTCRQWLMSSHAVPSSSSKSNAVAVRPKL
jgi:hypothetical protein